MVMDGWMDDVQCLFIMHFQFLLLVNCVLFSSLLMLASFDMYNRMVYSLPYISKLVFVALPQIHLIICDPIWYFYKQAVYCGVTYMPF